MKLIDTTTTIQQHNTTQTSEFKMKTSRKAFQILSDLYSDKYLAIVRELGCNAHDSHVAAGKSDVPFTIHLPNALEPWLTIQDFGTGISDENIYSIYTTYFESTKTNTNEQIGCLGLGSKSPFCYTDNFLVTSIFNGKKSIYNAYFNENTTPTISLMGSSDTDEPNGVAIQIPVRNTDYISFADAVKVAFRFFDIKPVITGGKINWDENKPTFSSTDWACYEHLSYGQCYAIMGGVAYPVNSYSVGETLKYGGMINKLGLVMKFEIGQLEFTPSREALSYTPSTIKAIQNKLDSVRDGFKVKAQQIIDESDNLLGALIASNSFSKKFDVLFPATGNSLNIYWRGIDVSNPVVVLNNISKGNQDEKNVTEFRYSRGVKTSNVLGLYSKWYYDDLGGRYKSRVVAHVKTANNNSDRGSVAVFTESAYKSMINNPDPNFRFDASLFTPVSTLPVPQKNYIPRAAGSRTKSSTFSVYKFGSYQKVSWIKTDFDSSLAGNFYVEASSDPKDYSEGFKPIIVKGFTNPIRTKKVLWDLLESLNICCQTKVIAVTSSKIKRLPSTCVDLQTYIDKLDPFYKITTDDIKKYKYTNDENLVVSLCKSDSFVNNLSDKNPFKVFVKDICTTINKISKYRSILPKLKIYGETQFIKPTFACPTMSMLVEKLGHVNWYKDDFITIAKHLEE